MIYAVGLIVALLSGVFFYNRVRVAAWQRKADSYGNVAVIDGRRVFYRLTGNGPKTVIIEAGLGTPSAEWWHIQDRLSAHAQVLTYDRAGYGWSSPSRQPRTSENIARELKALLDHVGVKPPYVLIGHSQGGLYLNHFARLFPDTVQAAVFVDPLSPDDNAFRRLLTPEEFSGSGVDKTVGIRTLTPLSASGALRLLKGLFLKSPPFYYYKDIPQETIDVLWNHLLNPHAGPTALAEYTEAHQDANTAPLQTAAGFPAIPVTVLYHSPQIIMDEIVAYGGLSPAAAQKIEGVWEGLVRGYLALSDQSTWVACEGANHFIHMSAPDRVVEAVG